MPPYVHWFMSLKFTPIQLIVRGEGKMWSPKTRVPNGGDAKYQIVAAPVHKGNHPREKHLRIA